LPRSFTRSTQLAIQGVVDFLVDDACHTCGRRYDGSFARLDAVREAVTQPVHVRVAGVKITNHPVCVICASALLPASAPAAIPTTDGLLTVLSAFHTNPMLLALIHRLKFMRVPSLSNALAGALAVVAAPYIVRREPSVLVPVPMDPRSERRRGFNQAERIATALGKALGMPVVTSALLKARATPPQSLAARHERRLNVAGAFAVGPDDVSGRAVILVDDLVTTGATVVEAAGVLRASGSASVAAACVARAL
jgi:ComF family protein